MAAGAGAAAHLYQYARQLAALVIEVVRPLELHPGVAEGFQRLHHGHPHRQTQPHGRRHALLKPPVHAEDQLTAEGGDPGLATAPSTGGLALRQATFAGAQLVDPLKQILVGGVDHREAVHRRHGGQGLQLRLVIECHGNCQAVPLAGQAEQIQPELLEGGHVLAHRRPADAKLLPQLFAGMKLAVAQQGDQGLSDGGEGHASTSSSQVSPVSPMKRTSCSNTTPNLCSTLSRTWAARAMSSMALAPPRLTSTSACS
ncbi:hypothetical protein D3C84_663320 [compost metagenome]